MTSIQLYNKFDFHHLLKSYICALNDRSLMCISLQFVDLYQLEIFHNLLYFMRQWLVHFRKQS